MMAVKYHFYHSCVILLLGMVFGSNASLQFTNPSLDLLTAGAPFNVTWSGASGTTTLTLQSQTASGLTTVNSVASGIKNSYILWSPYATTPTGTYVLRLDDTSGQSAYSQQFSMLPAGTKTSATTGLQFTNVGFEGITAGKPYNVTWEGASGGVSLTLQKGTGNSITDVNLISTGIKNTYLVWSPYATTPAGQYVLKLVDSAGTIAYSNMFTMLAADSSSSSSSSSSVLVSQPPTPTPTPTASTPSNTPSSTNIAPTQSLDSSSLSLSLSLTQQSSSTSSPTQSATGTSSQTAVSQTSSSATTTATSASAAASNNNNTTASPSAGLSRGAQAGIGIGASIGGLAVISTLVLLYLRRYNISISVISKKMSTKNAPSSSNGNSNSSGGSIASFGMPGPMYGGTVFEKRDVVATTGGNGLGMTQVALPPAEMGAAGENRLPVEMLADRGAHELPNQRFDRGAGGGKVMNGRAF